MNIFQPIFNNISGTFKIGGVPTGIQRDLSGTALFSLTRADLTNTAVWTANDPNSKLASAITDGGEGTGITIALAGGLAAVTDPFDGAYWTTPVKSLFGQGFADTGKEFVLWVQIIERSSPGLSTNYNVAIGVCSEATDSATIVGVVKGLQYPASKAVAGYSVVTGTATASTTTDTSVNSIITPVYKNGVGSTARMEMQMMVSLDTANGCTGTNTTGNTATYATGFGDGGAFIVVSAFRSATTAGTATGKFDFYYGAGIPIQPTSA